MKTIVFICVNFNNSDFTKAFCESLLIQNGLGLNIALRCVIVDNSTDEIDSNNLLQYSKKIPWVDYRKANDNLGYFGGLNYGLNLIKSVVYDYVVICNNDLVFDAQFCERLLTKDYPANVFAICPDVITEDGIHQNPHNLVQIGLFRRFQFDLLFLHYYFARIISTILKLLRPTKTSPPQPHTDCEIHMGIGACYVLTPTFFLNFNKLNYPHFLYAEEAYFTNQIHSAGGILWFDPDLRVHHAESASLSKIPKRTAYEFGRDSYWGCRKFLLNKKNSIK